MLGVKVTENYARLNNTSIVFEWGGLEEKEIKGERKYWFHFVSNNCLNCFPLLVFLFLNKIKTIFLSSAVAVSKATQNTLAI